MNPVRIWDCRRKEYLQFRRIGGDFEIAVFDSSGNLKTQYWFEMKKPANETYRKLENLVREFYKLLERQEE